MKIDTFIRHSEIPGMGESLISLLPHMVVEKKITDEEYSLLIRTIFGSQRDPENYELPDDYMTVVNTLFENGDIELNTYYTLIGDSSYYEGS